MSYVEFFLPIIHWFGESPVECDSLHPLNRAYPLQTIVKEISIPVVTMIPWPFHTSVCLKVNLTPSYLPWCVRQNRRQKPGNLTIVTPDSMVMNARWNLTRMMTPSALDWGHVSDQLWQCEVFFYQPQKAVGGCKRRRGENGGLRGWWWVWWLVARQGCDVTSLAQEK